MVTSDTSRTKTLFALFYLEFLSVAHLRRKKFLSEHEWCITIFLMFTNRYTFACIVHEGVTDSSKEHTGFSNNVKKQSLTLVLRHFLGRKGKKKKNKTHRSPVFWAIGR
jgi:hypothetical protein